MAASDEISGAVRECQERQRAAAFADMEREWARVGDIIRHCLSEVRFENAERVAADCLAAVRRGIKE